MNGADPYFRIERQGRRALESIFGGKDMEAVRV